MQALEGHGEDSVLYLNHNGQVMKSFRQGNDILLKDYFGIFVKINRGQEWKQGIKRNEPLIHAVTEASQKHTEQKKLDTKTYSMILLIGYSRTDKINL